MSLEWKSFLRTDRQGRTVRIIWADAETDVYEIHVYPGATPTLYRNSREITRSHDILALTRDAERLAAAAVASVA